MKCRIDVIRATVGVMAFALGCQSLAADTLALDDRCLVLLGNDAARVAADGGYVLNTPSLSFGLLRVRALCTTPEGTLRGSTLPFELLRNGWLYPGRFDFQQDSRIPVSL